MDSCLECLCVVARKQNIPESPKPNAQTDSAHGFDPSWRAAFFHHQASFPRDVLGCERSDSVGDVVSSVGDTHNHGAQNLCRGPEVFDFIVIMRGALMDLVKPFILMSDNIPSDAMEYYKADRVEDTLRMSPGERVNGFQVVLTTRLDRGIDGSRVIHVFQSFLFSRNDALRWTLVTVRSLLLVGQFGVLLIVPFVRRIVVVWYYTRLWITWIIERVVIPPKKRPHGNVPESDPAVFPDKPVTIR